MASHAGALIAGIGAKLATSFPTYSVAYGMPSDSGAYILTPPAILVRYMQEASRPQGNQLSGIEIVEPRIAIAIYRAYSGDSGALADHQSLLDLAADLRIAIGAMVMEHTMGVSPISGLVSPLWFLDSLTTPATLDIGAGASTESISTDFNFRFTRTFGGR